MYYKQSIIRAVKKYAVEYELLRENEEEGEWVEGIYETTELSKRTIEMFVHPLSDKEIKSLPEGEQTEEWHNIFTIEKINGKDRFVMNDKIYTIENMVTYPTHYEGRACRTGEIDNVNVE